MVRICVAREELRSKNGGLKRIGNSSVLKNNGLRHGGLKPILRAVQRVVPGGLTPTLRVIAIFSHLEALLVRNFPARSASL